MFVHFVVSSSPAAVPPEGRGVANDTNSAPIVIKRGRGHARSLDKEKLQMPLKSG